MAEFALAIICGSFFVVIAWRGCDRVQAHRLVRLRALADDFYPRAGAVLDDHRLNDEMLRFVMLVANSVADPKAHAWTWARSMLATRRTTRSQDVRANPFLQDFEFGSECVLLALSGLLLLAESDPLPGFIIRREVENLKRKMKRDPAKASPVLNRWAINERLLEAA